jgi:5-methylcytosine-specific restriction endonuclease McrA
MKCHICQKDILKRIDPSKLKRNKHNFCSRDCYIIFWAKERTGKNNVNWNSKNERICEICSKKFRRSIQHGRVPRYCSKKCTDIWKIGKNTGKANNRWKGGVTPINDKIRHSPKYIEWRNAVGTRDKIKCQFCGARKKLVAHHIKTFEKYPELRFKVSNGITLCRSCHMKLHTEHKGINDFSNILNDYMSNIIRKGIKI